jgi:hypothetical protein
MVPDGMPIPGYELENAVPVDGDGHFLPVRWKVHRTITDEDRAYILSGYSQQNP